MVRIDTDLAEIYILENFLNDEECDFLIQKIDENAVPSTVVGTDTYSTVSEGRTSYSGFLDPENPKVKLINNKIHFQMEIENSLGETIQGQRYKVGQQFKDHYDFFEGEAVKMHCKEQGNRTWTFMIYLNDGLEGGETEFVKLNKKFYPKKGMAVIWNSRNPDGSFNTNTLHAGRPVTSGSKYIITKWFRDGVPYQEPAAEVLETPTTNTNKVFTSKNDFPKFTTKGFAVKSLPPDIWNYIQDIYTLLKDKEENESIPGFIDSKLSEVPSTLLNMDRVPALKKKLHEMLLPMHEEWIGNKEKLIPSTCYGIRSYQNGATLEVHTDRIEELHISGIILVDQDVDTQWGLDIQDHSGEWHNIVIEPGQIILYESATAMHGRIKPLNGRYFRNFFIHYRLQDWTYAH